MRTLTPEQQKAVEESRKEIETWREKFSAMATQEQTVRVEANHLRGELKQAQRERDKAVLVQKTIAAESLKTGEQLRRDIGDLRAKLTQALAALEMWRPVREQVLSSTPTTRAFDEALNAHKTP